VLGAVFRLLIPVVVALVCLGESSCFPAKEEDSLFDVSRTI